MRRLMIGYAEPEVVVTIDPRDVALPEWYRSHIGVSIKADALECMDTMAFLASRTTLTGGFFPVVRSLNSGRP